MIICLTGQKTNGKDTAGEIIIELGTAEGIRFKRLAFADTMKIMFANSLGIYEDEIEYINSKKNDCLSDKNHDLEITYRECLINFGQSVKKHLGGDFWAHLAFSEIAPWPDIVVTDLRFEEEAEYVRNLGGYIIHLYREEDQEDGTLAGEQKLPAHLIDFELDNTKDIPHLRQNIQNILNEILYEHEYVEYPDGEYEEYKTHDRHLKDSDWK